MVSTTTSKGQITLPKAIRNKLNLKTGDKIEFATDEAGAVRIIPLKSSVRELKNMVPKPAWKKLSKSRGANIDWY
jgi:antitoxin PrlF